LAIRTKFLDEIGDTIFAIGMAAGIGLGASNLAIQVTKERAVLDAASRVTRMSRRRLDKHRNCTEIPRSKLGLME
jgi:hypothetical protein